MSDKEMCIRDRFHLILYNYNFSDLEGLALKDYDRYLAPYYQAWMLAMLCLLAQMCLRDSAKIVCEAESLRPETSEVNRLLGDVYKRQGVDGIAEKQQHINFAAGHHGGNLLGTAACTGIQACLLYTSPSRAGCPARGRRSARSGCP